MPFFSSIKLEIAGLLIVLKSSFNQTTEFKIINFFKFFDLIYLLKIRLIRFYYLNKGINVTRIKSTFRKAAKS